MHTKQLQKVDCAFNIKKDETSHSKPYYADYSLFNLTEKHHTSLYIGKKTQSPTTRLMDENIKAWQRVMV
jgi:hypothetical protein